MRAWTPLLAAAVSLTAVATDCKVVAEVGHRLRRELSGQGAAVVAGRLALALAPPDRTALAPARPDEPEPGEATSDEHAVEADGQAANLDEPDDEGDPGPDDVLPAPSRPVDPRAADEPSLLASIARETWIFAEPRFGSRKLGYLRAGALVARRAEPAGWQGCRHGWFRIVPRGYVCVGSRAALGPAHAVARLSTRRPDRYGLPYPYVTVRFPPPPLYARVPSVAEQQRIEPDRAFHLRQLASLSRQPDYVAPPPADSMPPLLEAGGQLPGLGGEGRGDGLLLGQARVRSGFALLASYQVGDRRFGLTTDLGLLPLDRARVVEPSRMQGVVLSDEIELPIAFVRARRASRYRVHQPSGALAADGQLGWRELLRLTGGSRWTQGVAYLETQDGSWVRADQVARIERFAVAPGWARGGRKWIDVSILRQALVAYEGPRPVYATLVSAGADGIADHTRSHATIQGTFLIHTKHVSVTMDGDEQGDEFDLRDVPFVQYFTAGYALHGAYWHDDFGTPRSHGCVNLAPRDAAWLFRWTDPPVPDGWHAALSSRGGTVVHIHP